MTILKLILKHKRDQSSKIVYFENFLLIYTYAFILLHHSFGFPSMILKLKGGLVTSMTLDPLLDAALYL